MTEYITCNDCNEEIVDSQIVSCTICEMNYCDDCMAYMYETGFVACGPNAEEYLCPICFTEGIDRGFIGDDFVGMTNDGLEQVKTEMVHQKK